MPNWEKRLWQAVQIIAWITLGLVLGFAFYG